MLVNYASSEGPAKEVADQIKAMGGDAITFKADVAKLDQVRLSPRPRGA